MKQGIRLFDFSVANAVTVVLAYLVLLCLCAGVSATTSNPLPGLIVLVLLMLSFVALFWYFVGKAPVLCDQSVSQGKKSIDKAHAAAEVFYNARFREKTVRIYDKRKPPKKDNADCIQVQATKANLKKLSVWLGYEIPEAPDSQENAKK